MSDHADACQLHLLGCFALHVDGVPVDLGHREQRVVALLALRGPQTRSVLAGTLWPDTTEERALASLRSALMRLRRAADRILDVGRSRIALAPAVDTDVARLMAHLDRIDGPEPAPSSETALVLRTLSAQDLLPGWYCDWVLDARDRLHHRQVRALESVARLALDDGRPQLAAALAEQAVALEPLLESTQTLVIRAHLMSGNPSAAIREYRDYARRLGRELGIRPSEGLTALVRSTGFSLAPRPARARVG